MMVFGVGGLFLLLDREYYGFDEVKKFGTVFWVKLD